MYLSPRLPIPSWTRSWPDAAVRQVGAPQCFGVRRRSGVRGNGGGSDYVYHPLLPFIRANRVHQFGVEFLATSKNAKATDTVAKKAAATCPECAASIATMAKRMRDAPTGTFTSAGPDEDYGPSERTRNPQRVAILIDKGCGSSCEQFALDARRHFKVKLFGRPIFGSLDLAPFPRRNIQITSRRPVTWPSPHGARLTGGDPSIWRPRAAL